MYRYVMKSFNELNRLCFKEYGINMTFKQYLKNREKEELVMILSKEGYNPKNYNLDYLIETGFLDKIGKLGKGAALAAGLAGGLVSAKEPIKPHFNPNAYKQQMANYEQEQNSLAKFWKNDGNGSYTPIRGNSVLVKYNTNIENDELKDDVIDQTNYQSNLSAKVKDINSSGTGMNEEEAIRDALRSAGRQVNGVMVNTNTAVRNDVLEKDQVSATGGVIVRNFKVISTNQNRGLTTIQIKAAVEIGQINQNGNVGGRRAGAETFRKLSPEGKFDTKYTKIPSSIPSQQRTDAINNFNSRFK